MEKIRTFIVDQDIFAQSISLNFRGRDKFATLRGGLITLLTYFLSVWLGIELFTRFYLQLDPVVQEYEKNFSNS